MLDNILTINRAETGQLEFQPTRVNLEQFCQGILAEIPRNHDNPYDLNLVRQENCICADLDKKLLRSILINLLTNAIKYSPPGSIITLRLNCTTNEIIFKVCDQGIGVSADDIPPYI